MDHLLSDRALTRGLPPTNLSYAEFVGMRVKKLSILSFKNDQKEYNVFLPDRTPDVLLDTDEGRGSDSDDEAITVKAKGRGRSREIDLDTSSKGCSCQRNRKVQLSRIKARDFLPLAS